MAITAEAVPLGDACLVLTNAVFDLLDAKKVDNNIVSLLRVAGKMRPYARTLADMLALRPGDDLTPARYQP